MPSFRGGGAERAMVTLANDFVRSGISVSLIVVSSEGVYQEELSADVDVVVLGCNHVSTSFVALAKTLRRIQPEATLTTLYNANFVALIAHRLAGRPGRLVIREASVFLYERNWNTHLSHFLASFLYRGADAFIVVSRTVGDELRSVMRLPESADIEIVSNSIGTSEIDKLSQMTPEPDFDALDGKPFILGAGRLRAGKGFLDLLESFATLENHPDLRLVILGEGAQHDELRQRAIELGCSDRFFMPGFSLNPYAWMSRSAVFVLSSYYEGCPNVLIQAVGAGCPVVSTLLPGVTDDLLDNGKYGRLVPIRDSASMASAIDESITKPIPVDVDLWRKRYSKRSVAERYLQVVLDDPTVKITAGPDA